MAFLATPWPTLEACTASENSCARTASWFLPLSFLLPRIFFPGVQPRWHLHDIICGDRQGPNKPHCMAQSRDSEYGGSANEGGACRRGLRRYVLWKGIRRIGQADQGHTQGRWEWDRSWRNPNAMQGVGVWFYRQQGTTAVLLGFSDVSVSIKYSKDSLALGGWKRRWLVVISSLPSLNTCFQNAITFFLIKRIWFVKIFKLAERNKKQSSPFHYC